MNYDTLKASAWDEEFKSGIAFDNLWQFMTIYIHNLRFQPHGH